MRPGEEGLLDGRRRLALCSRIARSLGSPRSSGRSPRPRPASVGPRLPGVGPALRPGRAAGMGRRLAGARRQAGAGRLLDAILPVAAAPGPRQPGRGRPPLRGGRRPAPGLPLGPLQSRPPLVRRGAWSRAIDDLDRAMATARDAGIDYAEALLERGVVLQALGDHRGARTAFDAIGGRGAIARAARLNRARLDASSGDLATALEACDALIAEGPDDGVGPAALLARADLARRLGRFADAEADLSRLLKESETYRPDAPGRPRGGEASDGGCRRGRGRRGGGAGALAGPGPRAPPRSLPARRRSRSVAPPRSPRRPRSLARPGACPDSPTSARRPTVSRSGPFRMIRRAREWRGRSSCRRSATAGEGRGRSGRGEGAGLVDGPPGPCPRPPSPGRSAGALADVTAALGLDPDAPRLLALRGELQAERATRRRPSTTSTAPWPWAPTRASTPLEGARPDDPRPPEGGGGRVDPCPRLRPDRRRRPARPRPGLRPHRCTDQALADLEQAAARLEDDPKLRVRVAIAYASILPDAPTASPARRRSPERHGKPSGRVAQSACPSVAPGRSESEKIETILRFRAWKAPGPAGRRPARGGWRGSGPGPRGGPEIGPGGRGR